MLTAPLNLVLTLALAGATCPAATSRADSLACDLAALARAKAGVVDAQARYSMAGDWGAQNRALALVAAATEQLRTARALCSHPEPVELAARANPFEEDPFEVSSVAAPWHEPIPVPGIPYLVDPVVEASCPGPDCPVVFSATIAPPVTAWWWPQSWQR